MAPFKMGIKDHRVARIAFWTCLLIGVTYSLVLAPPGGYIGGDMVLHGLGYAGITVLDMIGWPYRPIIMLLSIIVLESLQVLLSVRAFELSDIASNVAGVATAFVFGTRRHERHNPSKTEAVQAGVSDVEKCSVSVGRWNPWKTTDIGDDLAA